MKVFFRFVHLLYIEASSVLHEWFVGLCDISCELSRYEFFVLIRFCCLTSSYGRCHIQIDQQSFVNQRSVNRSMFHETNTLFEGQFTVKTTHLYAIRFFSCSSLKVKYATCCNYTALARFQIMSS